MRVQLREKTLLVQAGWEIEKISATGMRSLFKDKDDCPIGIASSFLYTDEETGEKHPQKMIFYTSKAGPETLAHEIGHAALHHIEEPIRDIETKVRHEVQAWLWAERKRGKRLQSYWLQEIIGNVVEDFPEASSARMVSAIVNALEKEGDPVSRQRRGAISRLVRWYKHKQEA